MQSPKFSKNCQSNFKSKYLSEQKQKFLRFFKLDNKIEPHIKAFQFQEKSQKLINKNRTNISNKRNKTIKFSRNVQTALPNDFFMNSKSQRSSTINKRVTTLQVASSHMLTQSSKSINVRGLSKVHQFKHNNNINTLQSQNQFNGYGEKEIVKQIVRYRQRENSEQIQEQLSDLSIKIKGNFKNVNDKLGFDFIRQSNRNKKILSCRTSVGKSKQFYENLKKNKYYDQEQKSVQFKILPKTAETAQTYSPQKQDNLCNLTFGNNFRQAFQKKINSEQLNTNHKVNKIPQIIQQNLAKNQFMSQTIKNKYQFTNNSKYKFSQISDLPIKKQKQNSRNSSTRDKLLMLSKYDCQINSQNILKTKINLMKTLQVKEQRIEGIRKIKLPKLE